MITQVYQIECNQSGCRTQTMAGALNPGHFAAKQRKLGWLVGEEDLCPLHYSQLKEKTGAPAPRQAAIEG